MTTETITSSAKIQIKNLKKSKLFSLLFSLATTIFYICLAVYSYVSKQVQNILYNMILTPYTTQCYRQFLEKLPNNAVVYDIGIGNARALLNNRDLIRSKKLTIHGYDLDEITLSIANYSIEQETMQDYINLYHQDIRRVTHIPKNSFVLFSNCWSLLNNPIEILTNVKNSIDDTGTINIITTLENNVVYWKSVVKKYLRYVLGNRLDFGRSVGLREFKTQIGDIFTESHITYNVVYNTEIPVYGEANVYNVTIPLNKVSIVEQSEPETITNNDKKILVEQIVDELTVVEQPLVEQTM